MVKRQDKRSDKALIYRRWYGTKRWLARRGQQLRENPLCSTCGGKDRIEPATVADHVIPHRGDQYLFWYGVLQSLCKPCHDHKTSVIEGRGWSDEVGEDGYPTDPTHPWYVA